MYVNAQKITDFGSFEVEHVPKKIRKFIGKKNLITYIYGMQVYDSKMYGYICIECIDFMLKVKSSLEYTNLFSPNGYEKNDKIILKYCQ